MISDMFRLLNLILILQLNLKRQLILLFLLSAKGLIFDVRNNGGGLLTPTLEILDYLLPEGTIATATYKNRKQKFLELQIKMK